MCRLHVQITCVTLIFINKLQTGSREHYWRNLSPEGYVHSACQALAALSVMCVVFSTHNYGAVLNVNTTMGKLNYNCETVTNPEYTATETLECYENLLWHCIALHLNRILYFIQIMWDGKGSIQNGIVKVKWLYSLKHLVPSLSTTILPLFPYRVETLRVTWNLSATTYAVSWMSSNARRLTVFGNSSAFKYSNSEAWVKVLSPPLQISLQVLNPFSFLSPGIGPPEGGQTANVM